MFSDHARIRFVHIWSSRPGYLPCKSSWLQEVLEREGRLPPILVLMMDNTVKENKNNQVIAFLAALVHYGIFKEVRLYFLPVGHTHTIIDQRFSLISIRIAAKDAFTLQQLIDEVKQLNFDQKWVQHVEVLKLLDYSFLLEYSHQFLGLGTVRQDGEKHTAHAIKLAHVDGQGVCLTYKDHDLSGPWVGHWSSNKPLPVFAKDLPPLSELQSVHPITALDRRRVPDLAKLQEKVNMLKVRSSNFSMLGHRTLLLVHNVHACVCQH